MILNNKYGLLNTLYNYGLTSLLNTNIKGVLVLQNATPSTTITISGTDGTITAAGLVTCNGLRVLTGTTKTGTIECSSLTSSSYQASLYGLSNLTTPNSCNASFQAGIDTLLNGSIRLCSDTGTSNPTIIQQQSGNLYIDNCCFLDGAYRLQHKLAKNNGRSSP